MKEILENEIYDKKYCKQLNTLMVTKIYHIYYNEKEKLIWLEPPVSVRTLCRIRKTLWYNGIDYENIIIGRPDI